MLTKAALSGMGLIPFGNVGKWLGKSKVSKWGRDALKWVSKQGDNVSKWLGKQGDNAVEWLTKQRENVISWGSDTLKGLGKKGGDFLDKGKKSTQELFNNLLGRNAKQELGEAGLKGADEATGAGRVVDKPVETNQGGKTIHEGQGEFNTSKDPGSNKTIPEGKLNNVQRIEDLPDGHHLKYLDDGRVFLCSPYCTNVTEFANTYVEVLRDSNHFNKKLAEIANISDEAERLSALNKLEDLARKKRSQWDKARIDKLNEGINKLEKDIANGKVTISAEERAWLDTDPRHKELAYDYAPKKYKVQEQKQL